MTINDLLQAAVSYQWAIAVYFAVPPILTQMVSLAHRGRPGERPPWSILYTVLIYAVSFPGVLACVLTGYSLLILRTDLRNVPVLLYFVPILSMFVTWWLARRRVDLDALPGFDRLSGFIGLVFTCFLGAFILNRLFFGVLFFGSIWGLLVVALILFFAFKSSARRVLG
jgi:hypothetical protein